jgi:hypothetical protein
MRSIPVFLLACGMAVAGEFPVGSKLTEIKVTDSGSAAVVKPSAAKATAVIFVSTQCPVSNAYNERMKALNSEYSGKGVQFAFVNSNHNEAATEVADHASKNLSAKVYKDMDNVLADKLNAQYTPEVFVFDNGGTLVYHGRIDDSREEGGVKSKDLRAALDAALAGKPVPAADTKAFGCTIKRVKKTS